MPFGQSSPFGQTNFLSTRDLSAESIEKILATGDAMKKISQREMKKAPVLQGRTIINCFLEPSTRTRTSFEIAGKRLSADVINVSGSGSSLAKGESVKDMMANLRAMNPDIVVVRSGAAGAPEQVSRWINCAIINAGDGRHEHPTQSMLDLMTIKERKGDLPGLKVTIVGDIANSRVARSNLMAMRTMGMTTTICGPATLLPRNGHLIADRVNTSIDEAIIDADVIMMLRIQQERIGGVRFPTLREYSRLYGLNLERMKRVKDNVIVMHPGPINQGIEIAPEVADGPYSVILDQVTNGVAVRMAIMYLTLGGSRTTK
jgi:aspartate carbamoyltransferase catalytic subunit